MSPIRHEGSTVDYLDPLDIVAVKVCEPSPWSGRDAQGYGLKIPTSRLVQLFDKRWRRVYVCQISNAGTAYVLIDGAWWIIGPEAEERLESQS
jgi:hypothetical protein